MQFFTPYFPFIVIIWTNPFYSRRPLQEVYPGFGTSWIPLSPHNSTSFTIGSFQTPSPSRQLHPPAETSLTFTLFTRENPHTGTILPTTLQNFTFINFTKPSKFLTHGWMSQGNASACTSIKNNFLQTEDVNIFVMDWSPIADNVFYFVPVHATQEVAYHYSLFLNKLINSGADPALFHLIGHSLGAHVSGLAARQAVSQIGRVTGLDPAKIGYVFGRKSLGRFDADYVDVVHTCGTFLGLMRPLGHADYYPNGGRPPQPGCRAVFELIEGCSHARSWQYFAENLRSPELFKAYRCDLKSNDAVCAEKMAEVMGKRGNYGIYYVKVEESTRLDDYDSFF